MASASEVSGVEAAAGLADVRRYGALVLSVREGGSVLIWHEGECLEIGVVEQREGKVRITFRGPRTFRALRREVAEALAREEG